MNNWIEKITYEQELLNEDNLVIEQILLNRDIILNKFRNWWLERLIDVWLDYYFNTQVEREKFVLTDKKQYRVYLTGQLLDYIKFLTTTNSIIDLKEYNIIKDIEIKYNKVIFIWVHNPIEKNEKKLLKMVKWKKIEKNKDNIVSETMQNLVWILKSKLKQ